MKVYIETRGSNQAPWCMGEAEGPTNPSKRLHRNWQARAYNIPTNFIAASGETEIDGETVWLITVKPHDCERHLVPLRVLFEDDEIPDGEVGCRVCHTAPTRVRDTETVKAEYRRLRDKVWWNRHMAHGHERGPWDCRKHPDHPGCAAALALIDRYGLEKLLPGDDLEWGVTNGQFEALAWVLGADWDEAGDT